MRMAYTNTNVYAFVYAVNDDRVRGRRPSFFFVLRCPDYQTNYMSLYFFHVVETTMTPSRFLSREKLFAKASMILVFD